MFTNANIVAFLHGFDSVGLKSVKENAVHEAAPSTRFSSRCADAARLDEGTADWQRCGVFALAAQRDRQCADRPKIHRAKAGAKGILEH